MNVSTANSPYRLASRHQLVLRGEPSTTIYLWGIWLTAAALVVMATASDDFRRMHVTFFASGIAVFVMLHVAARRVRWILTPDDACLRIERRTLFAAESAVIGVRDGLRLGLGMTERVGRIDPCIVLTSGSTRVTMTTGVRPAATIERVTAFLREHGVAVSELPDGPLNCNVGGGGISG